MTVAVAVAVMIPRLTLMLTTTVFRTFVILKLIFPAPKLRILTAETVDLRD
jgi:hypothetical protein